MSTILRLFWHSIALSFLLHLFVLDPATASFGDLLRILHAPFFFKTAAMLGMVLLAIELVLGSAGAVGRTSMQVAYSWLSRLQEALKRGDSGPKLKA